MFDKKNMYRRCINRKWQDWRIFSRTEWSISSNDDQKRRKRKRIKHVLSIVWMSESIEITGMNWESSMSTGYKNIDGKKLSFRQGSFKNYFFDFYYSFLFCE